MSEERIGGQVTSETIWETENNGTETIDMHEIGKEIGIIDVQMDNLVNELTAEGYIVKSDPIKFN